MVEFPFVVSAPGKRRSAVWLATWATCGIGLLLWIAVQVSGLPERWPPVEHPPRQGEALDLIAYNRGEHVHADSALAQKIREPLNTWSNLAFVWGGCWLLCGSRIPVVRQVGTALAAVGLGSFLYHASASRALRHLDVAAMYWLYLSLGILALSAVSARALSAVSRSGRLLAFVLPCVAMSIAAARNLRVAGFKPLELTLATGVATAVVVTALAIICFRARTAGNFAQAASALLFFAFAVTMQIGDRPGGWACAPGSWFQGHALWHVAAAVGAMMACSFFARAIQSPEPRSKQPSRTLSV